MLVIGTGFTMTLDITKAQFSTSIDTFKNFSGASGSISVPSSSYGDGSYKTYSTSISLDETDAVAQILQNFSTDSSKYYSGTFVQINVGGNFVAQTRMYYTGSTLTVDCYVVNQGPPASNSAFTLNIEVRRFLTPFA